MQRKGVIQTSFEKQERDTKRRLNTLESNVKSHTTMQAGITRKLSEVHRQEVKTLMSLQDQRDRKREKEQQEREIKRDKEHNEQLNAVNTKLDALTAQKEERAQRSETDDVEQKANLKPVSNNLFSSSNFDGSTDVTIATEDASKVDDSKTISTYCDSTTKPSTAPSDAISSSSRSSSLSTPSEIRIHQKNSARKTRASHQACDVENDTQPPKNPMGVTPSRQSMSSRNLKAAAKLANASESRRRSKRINKAFSINRDPEPLV